MKAPGDRRPGIWRNGVLQIKVCNYCDLDCRGCSVGVGLAKKLKRQFLMTPEQFRIACRSLKGYFGVVGMFGGNPCMHPKFEELCAIMREEIPNADQRGLWSNRLFGHGAVCRETFSASHSNLNVHGDREAWDEMRRDWPESRPLIEGLKPSGHAPIATALSDLVEDERERWDLVGRCYVNQTWSAEITIVNGELRAYFCEIAGTFAELYGDPSLGVPVEPGWWKQPMSYFETQARHYCMQCGIPLNGRKTFDNSDEPELYSAVHAPLMLTIKGRPMKQIAARSEVEGIEPATKYMKHGVMRADL